MLGPVGGLAIEDAAALAPDVLWFQLYRMARNGHALGFDLLRRATAGVHVLVITIDVPARTARPREVVVGLGGGRFNPDLRMILDMLLAGLARGARQVRLRTLRRCVAAVSLGIPAPTFRRAPQWMGQFNESRLGHKASQADPNRD